MCPFGLSEQLLLQSVSVAAPAVGKETAPHPQGPGERLESLCEVVVSIVKAQTKFSKKDSYKHGQKAGKGKPRKALCTEPGSPPGMGKFSNSRSP